MNTNSTDEIIKKASEELKLTGREKEEFDEIKIQSDFLIEVQEMMDKNGMNRQALASTLEVSRSYITQLFNGDKKINLRLIKKLQDIFGLKVVITFNGAQKEKVVSKDIKNSIETSNQTWNYTGNKVAEGK
jgi:ribosome-binding protein aMBF1 (putative translation factor)